MQHASCIIASVHHVDIAKPEVNISQFPRQKTHCFSTAVNNQILRPHAENMRQLISKCRDRGILYLLVVGVVVVVEVVVVVVVGGLVAVNDSHQISNQHTAHYRQAHSATSLSTF